MNTALNEKVRVNIFGKEYEMDPGSLTELEVSQLAAMVDDKMREIANNLRLVDTQKIAVLAALNIAFEMSHRRPPEAALGFAVDDERKINALIQTLDKALK